MKPPPLDDRVDGFPLRLLFTLFLAFLVVAFSPLARGEAAALFDATLASSTSDAAPGEGVTFWISISPLDEEARKLTVRENLSEGLLLDSTLEPSSCLRQNATWSCYSKDLRPFVIEVRVLVQPGTEGRTLFNNVTVESRIGKEVRHQVDLSAVVRVDPASPAGIPEVHVGLTTSQDQIIPGTVLNYGIEVTNNGTAAASNVSVVVSVPAAMILTSASPWPSFQEGRLTWAMESLPVTSMTLLFNMSLPVEIGLDTVQVFVAVTYADGEGHQVRVEGLPSSIEVVPGAPPPQAFPIGTIVLVFAAIGGGLIIVQRTIGLPLPGFTGADEIFLLHRSGLVLQHFSVRPSANGDTDIVGGMLTAVRLFVEDSVSPYAGPLREIRFGGGRIVFVNGETVTLAAVNPRGNRAHFADRAKRFLQHFERVNGDALLHFDGVAARLVGVEKLGRKLGRNGKVPVQPAGPSVGDVPRQ